MATGVEVCWSCGYDLTGSGGAVCPECGSPVRDLRGAIDAGAAARRRARWLAAGLLALGLTALVVGLWWLAVVVE